MNPTLFAIFSLLVPCVVAIGGGWLAYRQAIRVADRTASTEGRKIDLAEMEMLNRSLNSEVVRLRTQRDEDEKRVAARVLEFEERLDALEARTREENERIGELEQLIEKHVQWARTVIDILRQPNVAALLQANAVIIPDPPPGVVD